MRSIHNEGDSLLNLRRHVPFWFFRNALTSPKGSANPLRMIHACVTSPSSSVQPPLVLRRR